MSKIELANVALLSQNYNEAERIYESIIEDDEGIDGWLGLSICKLYKFPNENNTKTVNFCIDKCKAIEPQNSLLIENTILETVNTILLTYQNIIDNSVRNFKISSANRTKGALLSGLSLVTGVSSKSTFTALLSNEGFRSGASIAVDSFTKMTDFHSIILKIVSDLELLKNDIVANFSKENCNKEASISQINNLIEYSNSFLQDMGSQLKSNLSINVGSSPNDLKSIYSINNSDYDRIVFLVNEIKMISFSNFSKNEAFKKELDALMNKYAIGVLEKGNLVKELRKNSK
jgi:hydrogenase maturation factor